MSNQKIIITEELAQLVCQSEYDRTMESARNFVEKEYEDCRCEEHIEQMKEMLKVSMARKRKVKALENQNKALVGVLEDARNIIKALSFYNQTMPNLSEKALKLLPKLDKNLPQRKGRERTKYL